MINRETFRSVVRTALFGAAFASIPTAASATGDAINWIECDFADADRQIEGITECGFIEIFENRTARSGRKIPIHFSVVRAVEPATAKHALFIFLGGPGQAAMSFTANAAGIYAELRPSHDIVLVDTRGTGKSNPMGCTLLGPADEVQTYLGDMFDLDRLQACHKEVSARADTTQYASPIIADDIDDVRAALGYDKIDLEGGSYGSRLAQVYLRRHQENVRTMTLRGPAPTGSRMPSTFARDAENALDALKVDCAADSACNAAFPDFVADLDAFLARVRAAPLRVEVENPFTGEMVTAELSHGIAVSQLRNLLYWSRPSARMPLRVSQLADGDFSGFVTDSIDYTIGLLGRPGDDPNIYDGQYLSITCAEDIPFVDWDRAFEDAEGTMLGDYRLTQQRDACEIWPAAEIDPAYLELVESDIPTLIITGSIDPVTPPSGGHAIAEHLSNSVVLVLERRGHGLAADCAREQGIAFIKAGSLDVVDRACGRDLTRIPFVTEARN